MSVNGLSSGFFLCRANTRYESWAAWVFQTHTQASIEGFANWANQWSTVQMFCVLGLGYGTVCSVDHWQSPNACGLLACLDKQSLSRQATIVVCKHFYIYNTRVEVG